MAGTIIATFRTPEQRDISNSEKFDAVGNLISSDWEKGVLNDGAYYVNADHSKGGYEKGTSWGPAKKGDMSKVLKYFGNDAKELKVEGKAIKEYKTPKELQEALQHAGYSSLKADDYAGSETMNTLLNYLRGDDTGSGTYLTPRPRSNAKLSKRISKTVAASNEPKQTTITVKSQTNPSGATTVSKTVTTKNRKGKSTSQSNLTSYMLHPQGNGTVTYRGGSDPLEALGFTYNASNDSYAIGDSTYKVTPDGHIVRAKGKDEFNFGGRAINDQLFSDLEALSNSRKSLSPEWKIIAKEQSDKGIDLVSQLYRDGYIFNPETNMFENKKTGKNITKYSYPGVRTINFTPTMHFKTGGTLKRTIAHKFQAGGWINPKKGIWDYEDPEMQKKIMQGYNNNKWEGEAVTYLNKHQDLKQYLDNAYKTLSPKLQYFTPDKRAQDTYNGQWARISKASGTTGQFAEKMKATGYEYDKATGTYRNDYTNAVLSIDDKGNLHRKDAEDEGIIDSRLEFDPKDNTVTVQFDPTLPTNYGYKAAKNKALASNASKDWATIGARLNLKGKFYDTMLSKGFKYNPKTGEYIKDGTRYQVNNGSVRAIDKGKNYSHSISDGALKQLLGINK